MNERNDDKWAMIRLASRDVIDLDNIAKDLEEAWLNHRPVPEGLDPTESPKAKALFSRTEVLAMLIRHYRDHKSRSKRSKRNAS